VIIEPVTGVWFDPSPGNFTINESNQWSTANPGSTNAGTVGNGAVNLTGPAGTGGVTFNLTSLTPTSATVPSTVTVPSGLTTVSVPITVLATAPTGNVTINVTRNGTTKAIVIPIVANSAPTAGNDSYSVAYGSSTTVAAPGVLGNDSDPNGTAITAQLVTGPIKGSLTLNANGSFTYTANLGQTGADSFTYRASDGSLTSNIATVNLTIAAFPRISGTVELQSFVPDESGRIVSFELRAPGGTSALGLYAAIVGTGGSFNVPILNRAPGTYDLLLKDSTFLRGRVANVVLSSNGGTSSASFSLVNGDVDGDNEVSILDYIQVSNAYDTQVGDPGYSAAADLDKDGFVSILDYLIVSTNYELQGVD
jgi:VCBS repeat-containing protein